MKAHGCALSLWVFRLTALRIEPMAFGYCYQISSLYSSKGLKIEAIYFFKQNLQRRFGTAEALGMSKGSMEGVSHNADFLAAIFSPLAASHVPHRGNCPSNKCS